MNIAFRALLNLPQDTPVAALTFPINHFGWGCPDIRTRANLLFLLGYHEALDGRNTTVRVLLPLYPLPLGDDDASQVNRLLAQYGISCEPPSSLPNASLPNLMPALMSSPHLFVVTDASLHQGAIGTAQGTGIGILITDGTEVQEISWGFLSMAASSSALGWLGKLIAVYLCRHTLATIHLIGDSSATLLQEQHWVHVNPWVDRVAKHILGLSVWERVSEYWTPAQHDTGSQGIAQGWQQRAHTLASWGRDHPSQGFPLHGILLLLRDPPKVWWYDHALIFSYTKLLEHVRDQATGTNSPLTVDTRKSGYDPQVWQTICLSDDVSLEQHRVAAYLRTVSLLPRMFFKVPPRRYCGITEGNQFAHVQDCPVIYARLHSALLAVLEVPAAQLTITAYACSDHIAIVWYEAGSVVVALASELEGPSRRQYMESCCPGRVLSIAALIPAVFPPPLFSPSP